MRRPLCSSAFIWAICSASSETATRHINPELPSTQASLLLLLHTAISGKQLCCTSRSSEGNRPCLSRTSGSPRSLTSQFVDTSSVRNKSALSCNDGVRLCISFEAACVLGISGPPDLFAASFSAREPELRASSLHTTAAPRCTHDGVDAERHHDPGERPCPGRGTAAIERMDSIRPRRHFRRCMCDV